MEEIISTIVANGIWAVMFCGLLVFELRDSRKREERFELTIRALSDKLGIISDVRADAADIKDVTASIKADTAAIRRSTDRKRRSAVDEGGAPCPVT